MPSLFLRLSPVFTISGAFVMQAGTTLGDLAGVPSWFIEGGALMLVAFVLYRVFMVEIPAWRELVSSENIKWREELKDMRGLHRDIMENQVEAMAELAKQVERSIRAHHPSSSL